MVNACNIRDYLPMSQYSQQFVQDGCVDDEPLIRNNYLKEI